MNEATSTKSKHNKFKYPHSRICLRRVRSVIVGVVRKLQNYCRRNRLQQYFQRVVQQLFQIGALCRITRKEIVALCSEETRAISYDRSLGKSDYNSLYPLRNTSSQKSLPFGSASFVQTVFLSTSILGSLWFYVLQKSKGQSGRTLVLFLNLNTCF